MTPDDLEVVEPPEVSCLTMHRPLSSDPIQNHGWNLRNGAVAAAADNNLVVLRCHPAHSYNPSYLLLLDLDDSSLSTIPRNRFEYSDQDSYRSAGYGIVIMTRRGQQGGGGAFVLAELLFGVPRRGLPSQGMLCVWQPSVRSWVYKRGQLPAEVLHTWRIHKSFPVQSRNLLCWVDLLHGLLLCDPGRVCEADSSDLLDMCFVPLPHGCSVVSQENTRWSSNPQEFRNAACVDGTTIKFLTMDGFMEGGPISIVTYTLDLENPSQSRPSWMVDTRLLLEDLWALDDHVPRITPLYPILSTLEHDVVYIVVPGDEEGVEGCRFRGGKLLLSVDTRKTRDISTTQQKHPRPLLRWRYILAFSVSHSQSQWGSKHHQGAVEAIGMEPSGKRMKFE